MTLKIPFLFLILSFGTTGWSNHLTQAEASFETYLDSLFITYFVKGMHPHPEIYAPMGTWYAKWRIRTL